MPPCSRLFALSLLLTAGSQVYAASSVDLTVKGIITPTACTPNLSGMGVVDYGKISVSDLHPDLITELPATSLQMTVTCEAPTLFALKGIDNSTGSIDPYNYYGLGMIGDKNIGSYHLMLTNPIADGSPATHIASADGESWKNNEDNVWPVVFLAAFSDQPGGPLWAPSPIQALSTDLVISPLISPTRRLNVLDELPFNGSATLEVKYL